MNNGLQPNTRFFGSYRRYDPMFPPLNSSLLNDEFNVDQVGTPAGWTKAGGSGTSVVQKGALIVTPAVNGGYAPDFYERTLPAGAFTVCTHFTLNATANYNNVALGLRSSVSGRGITMRLYNGPSNDSRLNNLSLIRFTNMLGVEGSGSDLPSNQQTVHFLRFSYDGTTLAIQRSHDGIAWLTLLSEAMTVQFTGGNLPDRVSLIAESRSASSSGVMSFAFFRYFSTPFADIGRMITVEE